MPALMAAGASLVLRFDDSNRELELDEFYHDYQVNDLRPGEFIERIRLPLPAPGTHVCTATKCRSDSTRIYRRFAWRYRLELENDRVKSVRIACGGLAATVKRALHCEQALAGRPWTEATVEQGMAAFAKDFEPIT